MFNRFLARSALLVLIIGFAATAAQATDDVDSLARNVTRLESLREVKDVQRSYAQFAQFGHWKDMAGLFTSDASFINGTDTIKGRKAIASLLMQRGGGHEGLPPGALATELIDEPLVNLAVDGHSAKGRWMSFSMLADGKGSARIEGGIFENEYVLDGGSWKISVSHYYPQFSGDYATGWTNPGGKDLELVPYHYSVVESGMPVPPPTDAAPASGQTLATLQQRITALNDEDAVRNLQNAYGYYVDRRMWNDVIDLFADGNTVDLGTKPLLHGRDGIRTAMEMMGPPGLKHGELNDHPLFDTIVQIQHGGQEAISRGIEVGMIGEADQHTASWEVKVFRNRFVKEGGIWKLKELHYYPIMKADYFAGWGKGAVVAAKGKAPAFLTIERKMSGKPAGKSDASGSAAPEQLAEATRMLSRSLAFDGTENVSSAYGFYIDHQQVAGLGAVFAEHGNKQFPSNGFYIGRDRIMQGMVKTWPTSPLTLPSITFHWRTQPVILVSDDGRSANLRTRLFEPRTGKEAGGNSGATFNGGIYPNDQTVLENGTWRIWSFASDEPVWSSGGWKGGWASVKDRPSRSTTTAPRGMAVTYPPDLPMTRVGRRDDHWPGGTGDTVDWPGILPVWFAYRNPVTGRVPDLYWPDCVPCELVPDTRMSAHGYQTPPTGPQLPTH